MDKIEQLGRRIHNLESDLSYYVKRCHDLEKKLKGAISTEYGAFLRLGGEVLYGLDGNLSRKWFISRTLSILREYLGTDKMIGILAREINWEFTGILDRMTEDYPDFGPFEINLYCCMVINARNNVIMHVFDLGTDAKTNGEKNRLIKRIWALPNRARVKYMTLLEKKDCTLGKNLLSLHDLSKFCHGKPEKNKD
ncbi:MAG: hypothetical protein J6W60_08455 [Treponema sp.]|nr:hypothetical protein [Treponema sp.]